MSQATHDDEMKEKAAPPLSVEASDVARAEEFEKVHLPVLLPPQVLKGSLKADGSRERIVPADVRGRFLRWRYVTFYALIAFWAALPWIRVGSHPAVFFDVEHRSFYLFGATFNAQDVWLMFFLLTGVGFTLVYVTAFLGRVWCGWACPQTVFLEGVFRRIERLVEGPREQHMRRDAGPFGFAKAWRKVVKHALYVLLSFAVAHVFMSYFVSMPGVLKMVMGPPGAHPEAFAWAVSLTAVFYFLWGWFREQLCLAICPYGRLQSLLIDRDSLVIGYDTKRGEPRGKATAKAQGAAVGDCVDCNRCVVVCPTGIDIRNGLQIDCVACAQCIDACDEIMDRLKRPRGLIRYTSQAALAGTKTRVLRGRTIAYSILFVVGTVVFAFAARRRDPFEANLLRMSGAPYVVENGTVRNSYEVHLVNKGSEPTTYRVEGVAAPNVTFTIPLAEVTLEPMRDQRVPVIATMPQDAYVEDVPVQVKVTGAGHEKIATIRFVGAKGAAR
jgi:cytochrome c oxidase accessory protein FixG